MIEIQLRTPAQQEWAEAVELAPSQTGHNVKDGLAPEDLLAYFRIASAFFAIQETGENVDEALMDELNRLDAQVAHYWNNPRNAP